MLLWLWGRPAAVAPIPPLTWEPPYAVGAALKRQNKNKPPNFGHAHGMWKFPDQGLNPQHSSDPNCCSDNARSLTCYATRKLQTQLKKKKKTLFFSSTADFCLFVCLFVFMAAPMAYRSSWAGGRITAAAGAYATATARPDLSCIRYLYAALSNSRSLIH